MSNIRRNISSLILIGNLYERAFRLDASKNIVLGKRGITADTVLWLAHYFDMVPQFWMGLQMDYAPDVAADELADRLEREVRPRLETG